MARPSQLHDLMRQRRMVRFSRRFEDTILRGYVLDVGHRFFLLHLVSDRIWFDGFERFRISDISDLRPDPYSAFAEAALKKRGERKQKNPGIVLAGIEDILLSVSRRFPLVTILSERLDPDVCYIGRVLGIERGRVSLLDIKPEASWDATPREWRLKDITRVGFGADYENALYLVGGEPPGGIHAVRP